LFPSLAAGVEELQTSPEETALPPAGLSGGQTLRPPTWAAALSGGLVGVSISGAWIWNNAARSKRDKRWPPLLSTSLLLGGAGLGAGISSSLLSAGLKKDVVTTPTVALWTGSFAAAIAAAFTAEDDTRSANAALAAALSLEAGVVAAGLLARYAKPCPKRVAKAGLYAAAGAVLLGGLTSLVLFEAPTQSRWPWLGVSVGLVAGGFWGSARSDEPCTHPGSSLGTHSATTSQSPLSSRL